MPLAAQVGENLERVAKSVPTDFAARLPDSVFGYPLDKQALLVTLLVIALLAVVLVAVWLARAGRFAFASAEGAIHGRPGRAKGSGLAMTQREASIAQLPRIAERIRAIASQKNADVVQLVDFILRNGVALRASDIHFDPKELYVALQYRIDGVLYDVAQFPQTRYTNLLTRLKVLANLKTYVKDVPQDGRARTTPEGGGAEVDLRVSLMPTLHGEKAVLRIMQQAGLLFDLGELGFEAELLEEYRRIITLPQGMVFLTGPTGSGKTTTIYSTLKTIKETRGEMVKLVTIEDPIEYDLDFLTQTGVNEAQQFTFAKGLRSILRQDPDVIMVGEIRDLETAQIAIQAGLTGHLIFTSVHANSAAAVFSRLINLGVEPFLLASATQAVLSQRLVRKLCRHCAIETTPTESERKLLDRAGMTLPEGPVWKGAGCDRCLGKGYLGRIALYELLVVTDRHRQAITAKETSLQLDQIAREAGMRSLLVDGLVKSQHGVTSLAEVLRVALA